MKLKKCKILVYALSMGLVFSPNAVLAAGAGADEVILEEDMDGYWEAGEDEEGDIVWEDEDEDIVWDDENCYADEWEDEENEIEGAEDSEVEESAEVTESQEENEMPYIVGAQGTNSYKVDDAESRDYAIAGIYTPIKKTQLYTSAGAEDTAFLEIDENTKIYCYGYYTEAGGVKWYYVQYFKDGRSFIGFCSSEALK